MGVLDKFKDLVGIEEYDEEDITEDEIEAAGSQIERKKVEPRNAFSRRDKVVDMRSRSMPISNGSFKMIVTEPADFEECPKLVDSLRQNKPVILNLEKLDSESARKIFNFVSGATYALNGNVQKITENIFVFAPENVDIASREENMGFDFSSGTDWR